MLDPPATRAISGKNGIESRAGCTRRSLGYQLHLARAECQASKITGLKGPRADSKRGSARETGHDSLDEHGGRNFSRSCLALGALAATWPLVEIKFVCA